VYPTALHRVDTGRRPFSGKATVAACHIQIDDFRLPLGQKPQRRITLSVVRRGKFAFKATLIVMDATPTKAQATEPHSRVAPESSDAQLVLEVLRKDRKATAEFVNRHADHVYGYVRRRLIPHTEFVDDLVQEVFLAAWENLAKFRGESSLRSWLLGIARHKVEDYYRKCLREVEVPGEEEGPGPEPLDPYNVQEAIEQQQAAKKTEEVLASLPEACAIVLRWRYWEKRGLREIAQETGRTEKAIERLLARAREQFKRKWNER
jgi:RNA polymerase sigma-70 factor (ECF subfamily)